jgi:intein-encoded DNA endonuclease-like protein
LLSNGVYFRKSTENKELLEFPNIEEHLKSHFIRGYFDGDGSVYK